MGLSEKYGVCKSLAAALGCVKRPTPIHFYPVGMLHAQNVCVWRRCMQRPYNPFSFYRTEMIYAQNVCVGVV